MAPVARFDGPRPLPAGQQQEPFSPHILNWFGVHLPTPAQAHSSHFSYLHHEKGPKISQTSKISPAVQLT